MNVHYLYLKLKYILLVLLAVGSVSCSDETLVDSSGDIEEGIPVDVRLNFSAPKQKEMSRVADYAVENLYVIVCKENGSVAYHRYYDSSVINNGIDGSQPDTKLEDNWVTATLPTGRVYIYAFANVNDDIYPGLKKKLDDIAENTTTEAKEAVENLTVDIAVSETSLGRPGNTWVMSGRCTESEEVDYYTITTSTTDIKTIKLRRLDSIITFNITFGDKCTSFNARRWYVMNAPASSYVMERDADVSESDYGNWDASNDPGKFYNTFDQNEQNLAEISGNTFTFYMPENRKIKKSNVASYSLREKQSGDDTPAGTFINGVYVDGENVRDREFTYAPDNGTYVVILGTYEGTADDAYGEEKTVSAYVVYKIHLGYWNNNANDFFSERNTKYTYNVTVNGVDDIVVEVEKGEENSSGASGEVIFTEGDNIYTLDAHYENVLLTFEKSELEARNKDAFRCVVKTPFTSLSTIENCDKDWVKVRRNQSASTDLLQYPGDGNSALQSVDDMLDDLYYATHADALAEDYPNGYPRDISNLFTTRKDGKDYVTYTCYVNEYYYDYDEKPAGVPKLPEEETALWKYFVNQPNRLMYIVCDTKFSTDQESSVVKAKYILSQYSIQTIYSTDTNNGLTYAYGIETVNESGQLPAGSPDRNPTNSLYGWDNTWSMVEGKKWGIINHAKNGYITMDANKEQQVNGMNEPYDKAYIACMQRNRRSDSGNDINREDVKWYLPALQQYQAIYIGEAAMNEEAWLYHYEVPTSYPVVFSYTTDGNGGYKHYQSSTYTDESPNILWSEEGTSSSTLAERESWSDIQAAHGTDLHIRCMRNLGTVTEKYADYKKQYENSEGGNYVIGVPYLVNNTNSRRGTVSGELAEHYNDAHDVQGYNVKTNNKLSTTGYLEVYAGEAPESNLGNATGADVNYTTTYTYEYREYRWSDWRRVVNSDRHPREEGYDQWQWRNLTENRTRTYPGCESIEVGEGERAWRTPNLREFTLMANLGLLETGDVCRTKYYYSHRFGWVYEGHVYMGQSNSWGSKIRCVRDYEPE